MRKIPEEVQKEVLELWLEGNNYRDISSRSDVSTGAISSILDRVRRKTPDLDELRRLNLEIRRQGSSVQNALRGGRLLEKVNQLGINFDRLEILLKILSEVASERHTGEEKIVNASLKLMNLEAQFKKPYDELIQDFQAKQTQINHLELRVEKLRKEGQKLNKEKRDLKSELSQMKKELKLAVKTKKRLPGLSLERLAKLAEHAEREGSLDNRIIDRKNELESLKRRITFLRNHASDIEKIDTLLKMRSLNLPCPYCGWFTCKTLTRWECENLLSWNTPLTVKCRFCGAMNQYDVTKMLLAIGLNVLS